MFAEEKIEVIWDSIPLEILGDAMVEGIRLKNVNTDEERVLPTNAVFVAVGIEPMTKIYEGLVKLNDAGYIVTDNRCKTNIDGIYACGDVRDTPLRQVITAAADGAVAVSAMS